MTDTNQEVVKQYSQFVEDRDWDALREHVTDDFVVHEPPSLAEEPADIEEHIEMVKPFEWRIKVRDILSDGDKVATREQLDATQIEEFQGLPPGEIELSISSILIWRVEDGKVAEVWSSPDSHGMFDQMGVTFPTILVTIPKALVRKLLPF